MKVMNIDNPEKFFEVVCIDLTYGNVAGCAFQQTRAIFIKFKTCQCIGRFIAGRDS